MKCKLCPQELHSRNKSGYCVKCYKKSPKWLAYMRIKQREWYAKPRSKKVKQAYCNQPKIKAKRKKYNKKYRLENIDRIRVLKRNWARKNRENNPEKVRAYKKAWLKKQKKD